MFVEAINTIGTLSNAYEVGKRTQPFLGKIVRLVRDKKLNILICGASGTGKSTLGKLLSGEFGREDILQPYQISVKTEKLELDSPTTGSISVIAGQPEISDWSQALREIANNQVNLVINVVAYGYHSIGLVGYQNLPSYQPGITKQAFISDYLQVRQKEEIALLNQLLPHLSVAGKRKVVMMTLVTKQDLWWLDRHQVREHYQSGIYDQSIQGIQNQLGKFNFIHEYISASLLTENFASDGEILAPVAEGYDQKIQLINFDKVLEFIENNLELEIRR
jgi:energy-coupling factor transporter ATP-binding protein EcfA2